MPHLPHLRLVALIVGDPQAQDLWTLSRLNAVGGDLTVVRGERGTGLSTTTRFKRLVAQHGLATVLSRIAAGRLMGSFEERREQQELDRLLDVDDLRRWWNASGIRPLSVPHLNHPEARTVIAGLNPDIIVRVSGGVLGRGTFGLARTAAINIHHGVAPRIRGMWSIPWGILEGRADWIGATVHRIDDGIDTGTVLWRGSPQLAPGETATTLFMRAHLEAVEALIRAICDYRDGREPAALVIGPETSVYRSAPGLIEWTRFLMAGRGKHSAVTLERAFKC